MQNANEKVARCFKEHWLSDGCPECVAFEKCEGTAWRIVVRKMPHILSLKEVAKNGEGGTDSRGGDTGDDDTDDSMYFPRYV